MGVGAVQSQELKSILESALQSTARANEDRMTSRAGPASDAESPPTARDATKAALTTLQSARDPALAQTEPPAPPVAVEPPTVRARDERMTTQRMPPTAPTAARPIEHAPPSAPTVAARRPQPAAGQDAMAGGAARDARPAYAPVPATDAPTQRRVEIGRAHV